MSFKVNLRPADQILPVYTLLFSTSQPSIYKYGCSLQPVTHWWLALMVNLTQPRITWEERLKNCLDQAYAHVSDYKLIWENTGHHGQRHPLALGPGLCQGREIKLNTRHAYIHCSLTLAVDVTRPAAPSCCHPDFLWIKDWNLEVQAEYE